MRAIHGGVGLAQSIAQLLDYGDIASCDCKQENGVGGTRVKNEGL